MIGPFLSRRALIAGSCAAAAIPAGALAAAQTGSAEDGEAAERVLDAFLAAYNATDIDRLASLLAEDIHFEDPTFHLVARNREEMRPIYEPLRSFRQVRIVPFNRIVAAPWVVTQQRVSATLARPDGETHEIDVQGASIFETRGGLIRRWFDYYDVLAFREQTRRRAAAG